MKDTLILGFGSEILCDESIVFRIFERLKLDFLEADYTIFPILSLDIINNIQVYRKIIIIDTKKSTNGIPGKVSINHMYDFKPTLHLQNDHDISWTELIDVANILHLPITNDVLIVSIEVLDYLTISNQMSPLISKTFSSIFKNVLKIIQSTRLEPVSQFY